jgi:hypothetical protein
MISKEEIEVKDAKRIVMADIDLSDVIRYSCVIDGNTHLYTTDGYNRPHITLEQWIDYAKSRYLMSKILEDEGGY